VIVLHFDIHWGGTFGNNSYSSVISHLEMVTEFPIIHSWKIVTFCEFEDAQTPECMELYIFGCQCIQSLFRDGLHSWSPNIFAEDIDANCSIYRYRSGCSELFHSSQLGKYKPSICASRLVNNPSPHCRIGL